MSVPRQVQAEIALHHVRRRLAAEHACPTSNREMNRLAQLAGANVGSPSSAAQYNILAGNASNLGTRGLIGDISEILSRTAMGGGGMLGSQAAPYMMQGNFGLNLPGY